MLPITAAPSLTTRRPGHGLLCLEAADVDGNGIVDLVNDLIYYAKAALLDNCPDPEPLICLGKDGDFDINEDGIVDYVADVMQGAKFTLIAGLCQ